MTEPKVSVRAIGAEAQPLVTIDGFAPDPDALRAAAIASRFTSAGYHYPGLRAPLPSNYMEHAMPLIAEALETGFGHRGEIRLIDASFSIVTTPPAALTPQQRVPHCDAFGAERIALIHYLSPDGGDGTAFYRHRSTGFETVDQSRAPTYFERLKSEVHSAGGLPRSYIAGDTPQFVQTLLAAARYNRALLYRSFVLHSGAIAPHAKLVPDPGEGRLTITAFLELG